MLLHEAHVRVSWSEVVVIVILIMQEHLRMSVACVPLNQDVCLWHVYLGSYKRHF